MANPYIVGPNVPYSQLYGRDHLIQKCCEDVNNNIWLLGRRRSGKTSVLLAIEEVVLQQEKWFPVYITLEYCYSDDDIKQEFLFRLQENLTDSRLEEMYQPLDDGHDFVNQIRDFYRWLKERETGLLLLIDEIEQLEELEEGEQIERRLRRLFGGRNLQIRMIIGASRVLRTRKRLVTSPFINLFTVQYIRSISEEDAKRLILAEKSPEGPVRARDEVINAVLSFTSCEPYFCQYLCHKLYQPDNSLKSPTDAELNQPDVILDHILACDYEYLEDEERKILCQIIGGKESELESVPLELLQLGYIKRVGSHYAIGNYFMERWLQANAAHALADTLSEPASTRDTQPDAPMIVDDILQRKLKAEEFDVFLCHYGQDKPAVKEIGEQLKVRGILPWLDEWQLVPGRPWQMGLEEQIGKIRAAAVFVGEKGIGPWQDMEVRAFISEFVNRGCPVIPVILPDCKGNPKLPIFLKGMMWVDFRKNEPDPLEQLIRVIISG
jgi:hypothetical protein